MCQSANFKKIKKSSGKAIINIFINSSLSICKNLVLVSHNFCIRNCTNLDNVWMGHSCRSHYGFSSMHTACDHKWSLDNKVVFMMCLYSHVRNESIIGNKVIRFIFVLLPLFFIDLVYSSYYIDLFWVFMSKKCLILPFCTQFPEFTKNNKCSEM